MNPLRWLRRTTAGEGSSPSTDDLVVLGEPQSEAEAEVWQSKLEAFGIPCVVRNKNPLAYLGSNWVGMYEVQVRARDIDRASELLGLAQGR